MTPDKSTGTAIETSGLTKHYPIPRQKTKRIAVNHLTLTVPEGSIYGFLGPNGAGKTTTIKMLLGFTEPTEGEAWIFGTSTLDNDARAVVGYVPEQPYFHRFLTAQEVVRTHGALAGLTSAETRKRSDECLTQVEMIDHASTPLSKLSKGMVQRIALASALVGDPKLLILDEPSSGLDPLGRKFLRDLLMQLRSEGKTIFVSSHLLTEMESVCDTVGVLAKGVLVATGSPTDIVQVRDTVAVEIAATAPDKALADRVAEWGGQLELDDAGVPIRVIVPTDRVYGVLDIIREHNARLVSVNPQRESLEDAFVRLVS
ncbi:MAG TPA: ABC transporter ATP-binding protein [Capsulimonadaceae bacterium]|jgi:ABC-2 type transport system ATP-binding protein